MLIKIDDLLSHDEMIRARELLAHAAWRSGLATAGPQAAHVKNNQQLADDAPQILALRQLVLAALERNALFFSATLPLKILPPFFNRYAGRSNAYGFHVDNAVRQNNGGHLVRADISATLFLNDPADYEGGELIVEDTFGKHAVKLAAGSLVIYPSSSIHAVSPVTRGERIACFMFIQSMVRNVGQRRILYDMDMALLRLRQDFGDIDAVIRLTAIYHNLLRQWAET